MAGARPKVWVKTTRPNRSEASCLKNPGVDHGSCRLRTVASVLPRTDCLPADHTLRAVVFGTDQTSIVGREDEADRIFADPWLAIGAAEGARRSWRGGKFHCASLTAARTLSRPCHVASCAQCGNQTCNLDAVVSMRPQAAQGNRYTCRRPSVESNGRSVPVDASTLHCTCIVEV